MKVETKENQIILKEVYNSITLETREGKQLNICMRDMGFEKYDVNTIRFYPECKTIIKGRREFNKLKDKLKQINN